MATSSHYVLERRSMMMPYKDDEVPSIFSKCLTFIYNKEEKAIFGRTCTSWGKVCGYYFSFYFILSTISVIILLIALNIIPDEEGPVFPKSEMSSDLTSCALSIFPMINKKSPLIWFVKNEEQQYLPYTNDIKEKLEAYDASAHEVTECGSKTKRRSSQDTVKYHKDAPSYSNIFNPLFEKTRNIKYLKALSPAEKAEPITKTSDEKPCKFDVTKLGPCATHPYGYVEGNICFYIKINKALKWTPIPYRKQSELPDKIPEELAKIIHATEQPKLWIHCEGENQWDKDNIGKISYFPGQAIETYYFPFKGEEHYQSPLVAVQISDLKTKGLLSSISCYLWTKKDPEVTALMQMLIKDS